MHAPAAPNRIFLAALFLVSVGLACDSNAPKPADGAVDPLVASCDNPISPAAFSAPALRARDIASGERAKLWLKSVDVYYRARGESGARAAAYVRSERRGVFNDPEAPSREKVVCRYSELSASVSDSASFPLVIDRATGRIEQGWSFDYEVSDGPGKLSSRKAAYNGDVLDFMREIDTRVFGRVRHRGYRAMNGEFLWLVELHDPTESLVTYQLATYVELPYGEPGSSRQ